MRSLSQIIICLFIGLSAFAQSPHGGDLNISCSDCHNESGWKLIEGQYAFDHQTTGFVLSGQHRQTDCRECHSTLIFNQASPSCISCHADIHEQTTGPDCAQCHNSDTWLVNNITQIHQMGRFPLLGAHFTADCYACHPSASKLRFEPLGIECIDCHEQDFQATTSPNHVTGNFSTNCIECHFQNAFTWTGSSINHDFFPLTKGHQLNDCRSCHEQGTYQGLSPDCFSCHQTDFQATVNPNHQAINLSTTCTDCHTTDPGWRPAEFRIHDGEYFPIYSGKHNGEWNSCTDCHEVPSNYAQFTCISCHEHNKNDMDDEHGDVGGYIYESQACLECHPAGNAEDGFNHNLSNFPLTGAHITTQCADCHQTSYAGTPSECSACHMADFNETSNPNHTQINLGTDCASCHTTQPEWKPAQFDVHNEYYVLAGAHASIANECMQCHNGNYVSTPNTCYACHTEDYNQTNDPPHESAQFSTDCMVCHTESAWQPSTFEHDAQYFPIYSGKHQGEWTSCVECHTTPSNYAQFSCIDCHEHNQNDMNQEHQGIGGYQYNSLACFECHPTGSADEGFNHNSTNFPLTGAHTSADCAACHTNGYSGTPMECFACHDADFNQTNNPNHQQIGLSQSCETCHTTNAGWNPATFPVHNDYYVLMGAHTGIANDCVLCHNGNYNDTPNTCYACHTADYNQTTDPPHLEAQFTTDCLVCHTQNAWQPSTFEHDAQYFPIYSGKHQGEWTSCVECHTTPSNYAQFSCIDCHEHNQNDMNQEHQGIGGYQYNSQACFECHPTGNAQGGFNHNLTDFPLTGAHTSADCASCHANGYTGTPTDCFACHDADFNQTNNPNHQQIGLSQSCEICHTTNAGWNPATFPVHNDYYVLMGAHTGIANDCVLCHNGNYNNTPNTCYACHTADYNQTTNPPHASAQFPTECETCHTQSVWDPSTFNHDAQYFPIYSGKHNGEWDLCADCHTNPSNYAVFSCIDCHEHNQASMNNEHQGVSGYEYNSAACLACHPDGSDKFMMHNRKSF